MDREAWRAAIHGVAKSQTRLSDWTELNWGYKFILPFKNDTTFISENLKTSQFRRKYLRCSRKASLKSIEILAILAFINFLRHCFTLTPHNFDCFFCFSITLFGDISRENYFTKWCTKVLTSHIKEFRVIMLIPKTLLHGSKKPKNVSMETHYLDIPAL